MADGEVPQSNAPKAKSPATRFGTGFLRDIWYFAALSGDVKPGAMARHELLGEPVLIGRDRKGQLLALRRGQVVSREALMGHLYGVMDTPNDKIIEVFVSKLRKKLQDTLDGYDMIETIWGRGYMLCDPDGAGPAVVPAAA